MHLPPPSPPLLSLQFPTIAIRPGPDMAPISVGSFNPFCSTSIFPILNPKPVLLIHLKTPKN